MNSITNRSIPRNHNHNFVFDMRSFILIGVDSCLLLYFKHKIYNIFIPLQCDGGIGTNVMYEELYNKSTTKIVILGDGCSVSTQPTAQASHLWNLVQVFIKIIVCNNTHSITEPIRQKNDNIIPSNRSKQILKTHAAYCAGTQFTRQSLKETWLYRQQVIVSVIFTHCR